MLIDYDGKRLKRLRKRARLSQRQVIELTGLSSATIWYLERGDRKPQTKTLEKLLQIYSLRIQYWQKIDNVMEEPNGNLSSQTALRAGSPGVNAGGSQIKATSQQPIPVAHGLRRI